MLNCMHTLQQADLIWVLHNNAARRALVCQNILIGRSVAAERWMQLEQMHAHLLSDVSSIVCSSPS